MKLSEEEEGGFNGRILGVQWKRRHGRNGMGRVGKGVFLGDALRYR